MLREEDSKQNAEDAAKVVAAKAAEEKQKREDRVAVTKGLTDYTTMK
jgi:hypothetical protein